MNRAKKEHVELRFMKLMLETTRLRNQELPN